MDFGIFDTLLDSVAVVDGEKRLVYFNEAFANLCGVPLKRIKPGTHGHSLLKFDDPELFFMPQGVWGQKEATPYREIQYTAGAGKTGKAQVSIRPLAGQWLVVIHDVTLEESLHAKYRGELERRERAIVELKDTQDQLLQSSKISMLGQFVAGILHELNNPLALAHASSEDLARILKEEKPDLPQAIELSQFIADAAQRMVKLSQHLKAFVHSPLDTQSFVMTKLGEVTRQAVEFTRHFTKKRDVEVINAVPAELPETLVDPALIEQVLMNLIKNSYEAMAGLEPGKQRPRIEISAKHDSAAHQITLSVADNGPGIRPEVLKKLFTPFFTTKPMGQGTGLGLVVCSEIAEKHGGTLTVESVPGKRTVFHLALPVRAKVEEKQHGKTDEAFRDLRVLVVDDEPWIRAVVGRYLARLGCRVFEAEDGFDAIEGVRNHRPHVVVTDLMMPNMRGDELAQKLRAMYPETKIVLLSGSPNLGKLENAGKLFDRKIAKPFSNEILRKAILEILD